MDRYTSIIICGIVLISSAIFLAIFLAMNYDALSYVKMLSLRDELVILLFLSAICACLYILSFKENKRSILIGILLPLFFLLLSLTVHVSQLTFNVPNILQAPIEQIHLDSGLIGFVFISVNGFLLSHILAEKGVDTTERLLLSVGLGFGTTYLVMILLGILWEITFLTVGLTQITLLIALFIIAFNRGLKINFHLDFQKRKCCISKSHLLQIVLFTIISAYAIVAIYQTVAYPVIEWDALGYGVNYAKIIFDNRKVPLIAGPSIGLEMSANYPPGVQLLAVYFYALAGYPNDFYYRILQPIFGLATMILTYKFTMILIKNRMASLFAVFILASIPIFWQPFIQESYLMCLTMMVAISAYFFFKASNSNDSDAKKYEIIGTLFCGFSALTSYIGILSFGILLLYAVNRRLQAKRLIHLIVLASIIILPWYMRNFLLLGNPIYPFLGVGNYLDPLLESSTTQHFQNYLKNPLLELISIICKVSTCISLMGIAYLLVKRKNFDTVLFLYSLFVSVSIMAFYVPFSRYLIISLPISSVVFCGSIKLLLTKRNLLEHVIAAILIWLIIVSSLTVLPYIDFFKPTRAFSDDEWSYLSKVFEEADAWEWINENTPLDARIATYDIKEYYVGRNVMSLDGCEAIPLYNMSTIEESIDYLKERNVTHILSVPWAAPLDTRMLSAYKWCILTRYLGDPHYLPPVYVSSSGATVYHIGPVEEETLYETFSQMGLAPAIKHVKINLTITNNTLPSSGKFYIPIPVDYREGVMIASVNSCGHLVSVELSKGSGPQETTAIKSWEKFNVTKRWPNSANISGVENPSFVWQIDMAGYFTFLIVNQEPSNKSFSVSVDIRFYNYWDTQSLFISEGLQIYNIAMSNETFPLMKMLYIKANEPSILSINSTTFDKEISIEIFKDFLPNNMAINWSAQYKIMKRQPSFNETSGEVNPSIQNMFIPYGNYSILIIHRDDRGNCPSILLEIEFKRLK